MKFRLILLLILIASQMTVAQNLQEFRNLLQLGENSETAAKSLIEKSENEYKKTNKPIYKGFIAVGNFLMAKHVFNPFKKMSYFNEGKNNLEQAIKENPNDLELRLMRLITQKKIPKILKYNQQIASDTKFLIDNHHKTDDQNLKLYIKEYLKI